MDIRQVLETHRVEYVSQGEDHHASRGWVNVVCPRCSPGSDKFRLGYNLSGKYFSCWVCGYLPTVEALAEVLRIHTEEAKGIITELGPSPYHRGKNKTHEGKYTEPHGLESSLSRCHRSYVSSRGFLPSKIVSLWDVRGIGQFGGPYRWRLFLPILFHGKPVAWTTRKIGEGEPRYLASPPEFSDIPVGDLLYGVDHCRTSVVLVEGPIDAWAVGPGAVAVMGVSMTPSRLEMLSQFPRRAICFDSEGDAQSRARKLLNDLSVLPGHTVNIILETGKDPASAKRGEVACLRREFLH